MAVFKSFYHTLPVVVLLSFVLFACKADKSDSKTYIVHVAKPDHTHHDLLKTYHESFLPSRTTSDDRAPPLIYSYRHVMSGFAANLTPEELESVKAKPGFLFAHEETISHPHTTHSPDFLGLHRDDQKGFWKSSNYGQGVIVGLIDSGVTPDHPSFGDEGMPPPPNKWKGKCDFGNTTLYRCNNKLIGVRFFSQVAPSPLDSQGHGTHTASTAAGNFVANVSVLGSGPGMAAGTAPRAHLATYSACDSVGCFGSDILAAIDAAVEDGVDVISISLGKPSSGKPSDAIPYYKDEIAIGSFAAVQKGLFVSCSAGNSGPAVRTVGNMAPWMLTVGASTTDRSIKATAKLGDGQEFDGESAFQPAGFPSTARFDLVYAVGSNNQSRFCGEGSLEGADVKGKIVLCDRGGRTAEIKKGEVVKGYGASGMILANDEPAGFSIRAVVHPLPATQVSFEAGVKIKAYVNSTKNPTATIVFKGTVIGDRTAPTVAHFSSRGPSAISPGILKPDVVGPGVSVIAAWPFPVEGASGPGPNFNFLTGTSMACPHLSGVAALLKSAHPDWSPAAVKSAIATTADTVNLKGEPIVDQTLGPADVYGLGSGHVNPSRANDPGLVYDIAGDDYVAYLCGLEGYGEEQVGMIAGKKVSCEKKIRAGDLNYPTITAELGPSGDEVVHARTVTNVGSAVSSYTVKVVEPKGVRVSVVPQKLEFKALKEKLSYNVTFTRNRDGGAVTVSEGFTEGSLEWVSGNYAVRSVLVARFA